MMKKEILISPTWPFLIGLVVLVGALLRKEMTGILLVVQGNHHLYSMILIGLVVLVGALLRKEMTGIPLVVQGNHRLYIMR